MIIVRGGGGGSIGGAGDGSSSSGGGSGSSSSSSSQSQLNGRHTCKTFQIVPKARRAHIVTDVLRFFSVPASQ